MELDIVQGAKRLAANLASLVTASEDSVKDAIKQCYGYEIEDFVIFDYDQESEEYYGIWREGEDNIEMGFRMQVNTSKIVCGPMKDGDLMPRPPHRPTAKQLPKNAYDFDSDEDF